MAAAASARPIAPPASAEPAAISPGAGSPGRSVGTGHRLHARVVAGAILVAVLSSPRATGCEQPARLEGEFNPRTPGVTVEFRRDVADPAAAASALAAKYRFRITTQFSWGGIYIWSLDRETIEALRCEPLIEFIEYNAPTGGAAHRPEPGTKR